MIYGSVCSGIEAASVAWNPLGFECAFVSEIEPFPCAVLAHHYPEVPNWGPAPEEACGRRPEVQSSRELNGCTRDALDRRAPATGTLAHSRMTHAQPA